LDSLPVEDDEIDGMFLSCLSNLGEELECLHCELCNISVTDKKSLDEHLVGKAHMKKVKKMDGIFLN
jgi:hypothetical protein